MKETRTIVVTATDKNGVVLDRVEMCWGKAYPATRIAVVPLNGNQTLAARHPAQNELVIGK